MANKAKNNKNLIIGICAAVVVVIVVIVAIVLATRGGSAQLNDSYFVSDDTKYVLTLETDDSEEEYAPVKTHVVYFYSGDDVTGMKAYYEFADAASAKDAFDYYKEAMEGEDYQDISMDGKYIIVTSNESAYEDLTASDVKQQIEFMEMLKNMDLTEQTDDTDIEVEEDVTNEE